MRKRRPEEATERQKDSQHGLTVYLGMAPFDLNSKNNNNIGLRWLWITVTSLLFLYSDRHGWIEFDLGWQVTSPGGVCG